MKLKHLESLLQEVDTFEDPQVHLEQYPTPVHLAAQIALEIGGELQHNHSDDENDDNNDNDNDQEEERDQDYHGSATTTPGGRGGGGATTAESDMEEETVSIGGSVTAADLGCGTGMLSIALILAGVADKVYAFDADDNALTTAYHNVAKFGLEDQILLYRKDLSVYMTPESSDDCPEEEGERQKLQLPTVDLVIMNPPFGTRRAGIDMAFVQVGLDIAKNCVFSLHKTSTRVNPPFGTRRAGIDMAFVQVGLDIAKNCVFSLHKTSTREHITKQAGLWKTRSRVIAQLRYDIPRLFSFHSSSSADIEVDFIKFSKGKSQSGANEQVSVLPHKSFEALTRVFSPTTHMETTYTASNYEVLGNTGTGDFDGIDRRSFRRNGAPKKKELPKASIKGPGKQKKKGSRRK